MNEDMMFVNLKVVFPSRSPFREKYYTLDLKQSSSKKSLTIHQT